MWQQKDGKLYKKFTFDDFKNAFDFMTEVSNVAERLQHHPEWFNRYNVVEIWLSTHNDDDQITDKDRNLAEEIDKITQHPRQQGSTNDKKQQYKEVKLFADGGSRGNPGPSASGYALLDMDDNVLHKSGLYLGITTNNQAEYHSLKAGLQDARKRNTQILHVFMDSMLVINQMKGIFKVKNRDLWPIYEECKQIATGFKKINFTHVPREFNKIADGMVNEILDSEKNKK